MRRTQRGLMLQVYREHQGNQELAIQAYAEAERRGQVRRLRNSRGISAEAYARALLADGLKKGWLRL